MGRANVLDEFVVELSIDENRYNDSRMNGEDSDWLTYRITEKGKDLRLKSRKAKEFCGK